MKEVVHLAFPASDVFPASLLHQISAIELLRNVPDQTEWRVSYQIKTHEFSSKWAALHKKWSNLHRCSTVALGFEGFGVAKTKDCETSGPHPEAEVSDLPNSQTLLRPLSYNNIFKFPDLIAGTIFKRSSILIF